jgi:hypothetical protein
MIPAWIAAQTASSFIVRDFHNHLCHKRYSSFWPAREIACDKQNDQPLNERLKVRDGLI